MGVTIHFRGKLCDERALARVVEVALEQARRHGWKMGEVKHGYRGVVLFPDDRCDPLRLEFDEALVVDDFVKSQFADVAVHQAVVDVLRAIAPCFEEFDVEDEGEYWETGDRDTLVGHRECFEEALAAHLRDHPTARGPVRLPDGRWADVIE